MERGCRRCRRPVATANMVAQLASPIGRSGKGNRRQHADHSAPDPSAAVLWATVRLVGTQPVITPTAPIKGGPMTEAQELDAAGRDESGQPGDLLNAAIARIRGLVEADVARVRRRRPGLSPDELARALVKRGTRRVGAAGLPLGSEVHRPWQ